MIPVSLFPSRSTDPDIGLHLLQVVHSGLDHGRLIDIVLGQAPALQGAFATLSGPPRTTALPLLRLGLVFRDDLLVVLCQDLLHIWQRSVADLQVVSIEDLGHDAAPGEAAVDQRQKLCTDVGLHVDGVRRIPPDHISSSPPL